MDKPKKFHSPTNVEAERALIGAIMVGGNETLRRVDHIVGPDDFTVKQYHWTFLACQDLHMHGTKIDIVTLCDELDKHGMLEELGGSATIIEPVNEVPTAIHAVHYARIVANKAALRRVLEAGREIGKLSQDESAPVEDTLVKAEKILQKVTRGVARQSDKLETVDLADWMKIARETRGPVGSVEGLSTGLFKVDKMTQGFVPGELMIISGQTSHGKTQLTNNILLRTAQAGKKSMFITMEMTKREIGERFNLLNDDKDIEKGRVLLNMRNDLKYTDVTRLVERAKEQGCELVVIDHLHYFSRSVENATAEISKIVKEFKEAAVLYELPIILICHVRKMAPKKHPTIEDLRDSSLIAQDADMVLIVWRDENPNAANPNEVEIVLWKNRNRQKKHRREFLYADGMKLVEDDPRPASDVEKQRVAANNARMIGEKEDEGDLFIPDWPDGPST